MNRYRIHQSNPKKPICNSHEGCKQELIDNAHHGTPVHIAVLFDEKLDWKHLHKLALEYAENPKEEEKNQMLRTIWAFAYSLGCPKCRKHFLELLKNNPPDL